jgi:hypothetical protein
VIFIAISLQDHNGRIFYKKYAVSRKCLKIEAVSPEYKVEQEQNPDDVIELYAGLTGPFDWPYSPVRLMTFGLSESGKRSPIAAAYTPIAHGFGPALRYISWSLEMHAPG